MEWVNELIKYLKYDPQTPILFTGVYFWIFFLILLLGYGLVYNRPSIRNAYLFAASLFFYYKCSGIFILLLIFSIVVNYFLGIGIYKSNNRQLRRFYVFLSVVVCILLLSYFKYSYFFIGLWNEFFSTHLSVVNYFALMGNSTFGTHFDISTIFLPAGISFYSFQALSYIIDLYRKKTKPVKNIIDFGFYKSFFPQLIAGPIVRAAEFVPQMYVKYILSNREAGHAFFLILNGLLKKMLISDYISINFVDRIFDNPSAYSGFENLMGVYGYALQIYCDFSGYTDIAIGVALLLGFRIPINFNSPYKAISLTDFWRRWHISLSLWLRDYLYIPLGGNRKGKILKNINLLVTMLIGGMWHGASIRFIIWGGLHGIGLVVNKYWEKLTGQYEEAEGLKRFFYQVFTFHFVCFAWIFFRSPDMIAVKQVLTQIVQHFNFMLIPVMLKSYMGIFGLMAFAYMVHWLPSSWKEKYRGWFIKTPLYTKVIISIFVILLIYQFKSAVIQPFIYFQF